VFGGSTLGVIRYFSRYIVVGVVLSGIRIWNGVTLMVLIVGESVWYSQSRCQLPLYDGFTSAIGTVLISNSLPKHYENHIDPMTRDGEFCMLW
jgi:hypothetical protein